MPVPGGSAPGGVPATGGMPGLGGGGAWWRPSPGTATAVGGTHSTGMHSCFHFSLGGVGGRREGTKLYASYGIDQTNIVGRLEIFNHIFSKQPVLSITDSLLSGD